MVDIETQDVPVSESTEFKTPTSHNILIIQEIISQPIGEQNFMQLKAVLRVELQFHCPVTGNKFAALKISSEASNPDLYEAFRMCMEQFFNNDRILSDIEYYNVERECMFNSQEINYIDYRNIQDPQWKKFFEQMFSHQDKSFLKKYLA